MQPKDTPDRVTVQLNMSAAERQALKAIAAAEGTSMTQWLLRQIAVAAKQQGIQLPEASVSPTPPRVPRKPFSPGALVVSNDGEEQWRALAAALNAIRGRDETEQEWRRIHALYLGAKAREEQISKLYRAAKTWRASSYQRKLPERLQLKFEVLLEFEPLKKKWFAEWSKRTGYAAQKAKERRLRNLDAARQQEAARQAKCQRKKRLEKAEHIAAFELEHVTGPDDGMEAVFDAAAE